jgi:hypothetical protein
MSRLLILLLRRLADRDAVLLGAMVASARLARLSEDERTVKHGPVELANVQDFDQLRLELTVPQGRIGLADGNAKPGNNRKRLQLRLEVPGYAAGDAGRLEADLAFPARLAAQLPAAGELLHFLLVTRVAAWLRLSRREETWKTAEILILRHQLAIRQRRQPRRPKLNWADRALLATLLGSNTRSWR